jgi:hypothetical protein
MFYIIYPDRWFVWTIAIILVVFIILEGAIVQFAIEQRTEGELVAATTIPRRSRTATSIDTTSWKTFESKNISFIAASNKNYEYEFKYPSDWVNGDVYPYGNDTDLVYSLKGVCDNPGKENQEDLYWAGLKCDEPARIYVANFPKNIFIEATDIVPASFDQYGGLVIKHDENFPGYVFTSIKNFNILNHRAIRLSGYKKNATYKSEQVLVEMSADVVLNINLRYLPSYESKMMSVFDGIVSTLKFFEPTR